MKKIFLLLVFLITISVFVNSVSGTVVLSQLNPIYNLGDSIAIEAKVLRAEAFTGFLRIILFCNNAETLMYFSPISLEKNKEKNVAINFPVKTTGSCYISSILEDNDNKKIEETKSSSFVLSDKIDVTINLSKKEFKPEDYLEIKGAAIKANGKEVEGVAVLTFNGKEILTSVSGGKFKFMQKLEPNIAPNNYEIIINVKDNSNNSGITNTTIKVLAIPKALVIETNNESFLPETLLMITPKLLDQVNGTVNATIKVKILKQGLIKSNALLEELVESGNSTIFRFTKFNEPGEYIIEASTFNPDFNVKKTVVVEIYEKIKAELKNNTLYVENIGNVPFKQPMEIELLIENKSYKKVIDLNLKIAEAKEFKLEAPKGTYDITVKTGTENLTFSDVALTGSVVATIDLAKENKTNIKWFWIVLVIIISLLIILLLGKINKKSITKELSKEVSKSSEISSSKTETKKPLTKLTKKNFEKLQLDSFSDSENLTVKKIFTKHASKLAACRIVPTIVYGTKQEVTALFMHLDLDKLEQLKKKNTELYFKTIEEYFAAITDKIKEHQGVADLYGNKLLVLFNVIKQYRHDSAAIKTAEAIKNITFELNRALANAGTNLSLAIKAGINVGMINVNAIQNKEIRYTSIGNTVALAKALEAKAIDGEILLSEKIYERVANIVKAKKMQPYYLTENQGLNVYSLESTNNIREKSQWYVDRALKS